MSNVKETPAPAVKSAKEPASTVKSAKEPASTVKSDKGGKKNPKAEKTDKEQKVGKSAVRKKDTADTTATAKKIEQKIKDAKEKPKTSAPKKEKVEAKKDAQPDQNSGVSEYLRSLMIPKTGTVCAITYSEANKKIKEKFPTRKMLYSSEFDRNFVMLKKQGVLTEKQAPRINVIAKKEEKAAPSKGTVANVDVKD